MQPAAAAFCGKTQKKPPHMNALYTRPASRPSGYKIPSRRPDRVAALAAEPAGAAWAWGTGGPPHTRDKPPVPLGATRIERHFALFLARLVWVGYEGTAPRSNQRLPPRFLAFLTMRPPVDLLIVSRASKGIRGSRCRTIIPSGTENLQFNHAPRAPRLVDGERKHRGGTGWIE